MHQKSCFDSVSLGYIIFFCYSSHFLLRVFSTPRQQNYSPFHVMDPKKPFSSNMHPFSLSLNPFFLQGQYSALSLLFICSAPRLAHKSCLLLTYPVSPISAQVPLSSSATSSQKSLSLLVGKGRKLSDILALRCSFNTTEESSVLPEG